MTNTETLVFVGTYTMKMGHVDGKAKGVDVFRLDMETGALSPVSKLDGQENPAYLDISPDGKFLYIANELDKGMVTACSIAPENGQLSVLNTRAAQGKDSAHIAVHENGHYAFVANYSSGNFTVYPIQEDGSLGEATAHIQHEGSSINKARQETAHAHCVAIDSAKNRIFVADLGMDKIMMYDFDAGKGRLSPAKQAFIDVQAGAGVRHLVFHPSYKWLFAINELDSTIIVFDYEREAGSLEAKQTISTLPDDFTGESTCAAIHVHPSGKFVYGSNRGHDSIAIFAIDEQSGKLSVVGYESTQGKTPRDFGIDPSGAFLLAANQDTDTIVTFRIDSETGKLEDVGQKLETMTPVCVKFLRIG